MSDAGDITPPLRGRVSDCSMVDGGQAMAAKLEQTVGLAVAGEKPLGMPQRPDRYICRSRRRVGWCETFARLFG